MRVGFTGHQSRPGIQWPWVREQLGLALDALGREFVGYSSLAVGADQIFAEEVISRGCVFNAVIPYATYENEFEVVDAQRYRLLLNKSAVVELDLPYEGEQAFFEAGRWIVDRSEVLMTVWDGKPSQGFGGTADIVAYAEKLGRPIVHIDVTTGKVTGGGNQ